MYKKYCQNVLKVLKVVITSGENNSLVQTKHEENLSCGVIINKVNVKRVHVTWKYLSSGEKSSQTDEEEGARVQLLRAEELWREKTTEVSLFHFWD